MAEVQRVRITAELVRPAPPPNLLPGPAQWRVRLVDHSGPEPATLAVVTMADAVALRDQLTEAISAAEAAERPEPAGGHDPGT